MQFIECNGPPYELGFQHGQQAAEKIRGSIAFYADFFAKECNLGWEECQHTAEKWLPYLEQQWPLLVQEMRGTFMTGLPPR